MHKIIVYDLRLPTCFMYRQVDEQEDKQRKKTNNTYWYKRTEEFKIPIALSPSL